MITLNKPSKHANSPQKANITRAPNPSSIDRGSMANSTNNHGGCFMKLCTAVLTSSECHNGAKRSAQVPACTAKGKSNQVHREIGNDRQ